MLKLGTVYPYALNDSLGDEYIKKDAHVHLGNKFSSLPRNYDRFSLEQPINAIIPFLLMSFSVN